MKGQFCAPGTNHTGTLGSCALCVGQRTKPPDNPNTAPRRMQTLVQNPCYQFNDRLSGAPTSKNYLTTLVTKRCSKITFGRSSTKLIENRNG